MFTLGGGGPWMCTVPETEWPTDDPEVIQAIKTDFMGTWGDRKSYPYRQMISTDRPGRQERQFDLDSTYSELTNSRLHRSRYRSRSH